MYNLIFRNLEVLTTLQISERFDAYYNYIDKDSVDNGYFKQNTVTFAMKVPTVTLIISRIKKRCLLVELYHNLS